MSVKNWKKSEKQGLNQTNIGFNIGLRNYEYEFNKTSHNILGAN